MQVETKLSVHYLRIIPLALVGYEVIMPDVRMPVRASLAIYHLISNARSWNNC